VNKPVVSVSIDNSSGLNCNNDNILGVVVETTKMVAFAIGKGVFICVTAQHIRERLL
jgi:hypothetical protein